MSRSVHDRLTHIKKIFKELEIHPSNDSPVACDRPLCRPYGFINFTPDDHDEITRLAQYIHLAYNTNIDKIVKFTKDAWRLRTPDLIISIIGGEKFSDPSARLRRAFQVGVVSAAATTNAWIITAGTNEGVVKEVGEALNKYRYKNEIDGLDIPCIGIVNWNYSAARQKLDRLMSTGSDDGRTSVLNAIDLRGNAGQNIQTYILNENQETKYDLEPHHTHFLLFDDASSDADDILPLRAEIEKRLRYTNLEETIEGAVHTLIPLITVLFEGGPSEITTICKALDANIPIVVVKESGGAADLISNLHECISKGVVYYKIKDDAFMGETSKRTPSFSRTSIRITEINAIFARARMHYPWVAHIRDDLLHRLVEKRQLVTIFNFDNSQHHGKLDEAILEAVFNAAKFSHESNEQYQSAAELKLALAWRNVNYARRAIFTDEIVLKWKDEDLRQCLVDALRRGYTDFIDLFIEYDVKLQKLTMKDLDYLYSTASEDKVLPLTDSINTLPTREDFYAEYLEEEHPEIGCDKNTPLGDNAIRDLFFWALFLDRFDFALYLCSKTWNQTVACLFGALVYRKAAKISLDSETKEKYRKNSEKFDRHAAEITDRCFENDRDFSIRLLRQPAGAFYNTHPLRLALKANCRAYLASRSVQKQLDNQWFGNINYKRPQIDLRVFLCSVFFPLLPIFCWSLPYLKRNQPFNPNSALGSKNRTNVLYTGMNVPWTDKFMYFYRAPIVRFYYNLIFFIIFLGLFSFVILVDFYPYNAYKGTRPGMKYLPLPITEICLHICVWGIILEEIRQFFVMQSYVDYLDELSNLYDVAAIFVYLLGFSTRFIMKEGCFTISKILLGIDLILWYVRVLHLFAAYERLGPKLIMIFNTMKDLLFFVYFILIFLFGFSITSWSLIHTSSQIKWIYDDRKRLINVTIEGNQIGVFNWKLLRDVTNYGVWKIFGQVEIIDNNNVYSAVAFVLAILFVTISNVLLLNVLIALFNVTIENVQHQSHDLWRYQRFLLVNEFRMKSFLPPPFNIINCIFDAIIDVIACYRRRAKKNNLGTSDNPSDQTFKITDAMKRESAIAEDFWRNLLKHVNEKTKIKNSVLVAHKLL